MLRRSLALAALALSLLGTGTPSWAADHRPYSAAAFEQAQRANKPILVDIYASWCPTCQAQDPVIRRLSAQPAYADLIVFRVDFDDQKDAVRRFGAQRQSTLIAFRGARETGRNVGVTAYFEIERLLATTAPAR